LSNPKDIFVFGKKIFMSKAENSKETPLMSQYFKVKARHPDAILLFRVGDFYETFGDDAVKASSVLGIVLTNRNNGGGDVPLAGFPFHSLDTYLPRLVKGGFRVAICEQLEKPDPQKKIVKRGVTEIITPGVTLEHTLLETKKNNYLAAVHFNRKEEMGIAFLDISTGEFLLSEGDFANADKLIRSLIPSEIILGKDKKIFAEKEWGPSYYLTWLDEWVCTFDYGREKLLNHFEVLNLKGFGVDDLLLGQVAAGAILHYLETTENKNLKHISTINRIQPENYVWLDRFTVRNLELINSPHESGFSLLDVLDHTVSPMGSRLLKKWTVLPLRNQSEIEARLNAVTWFFENMEEGMEISKLLLKLGDLERLISRVPMGKINPREVNQLKKSLSAIDPLKDLLIASNLLTLIQFAESLNPCVSLTERINLQIVDDPPVNLYKGGVIADGFSTDLDQWRFIIHNSKDLLINLQQKEMERSGIQNLKIGYNSVFGYYLEVTNKHKDATPADWIRKQTLSNGERFVTEELKVLEAKILQAEEKSIELENQLFNQLVFDLQAYILPIQINAQVAAQIDCFLSFATIAKKYNYTRPKVNQSFYIDIKQGRHPVIEQKLPQGEFYVPNDTYLDNEQQQILMITGPNMAGKSAVLRQTALICLMAQMGSFVPALSAEIGILDKIFTRVGASDNISSGESTFMVEMNETASILNNISSRSLVLLDEIGRGTSTYDGISIAWSIAEFLHENNFCRAKTLFATHYHELNALEDRFPRIHNFHIATKEIDKKIIFLRKLTKGGSEHSFGIHVARMSGMPKLIIERAGEILLELENNRLEGNAPKVEKGRSIPKKMPEAVQLSIFETVDPVAGQIKETLTNLDINTMTPIDCMLKIRELKNLLES
jgi:DNA mismatch repair protein MutS